MQAGVDAVTVDESRARGSGGTTTALAQREAAHGPPFSLTAAFPLDSQPLEPLSYIPACVHVRIPPGSSDAAVPLAQHARSCLAPRPSLAIAQSRAPALSLTTFLRQ
ncbi:hypothetical protein FH972_022208 [Carpinus fangiana]|uniref:Uncharacterized protein n=1 Tax=Carpinus fangiana TaxID=176857 RepID=A0A5N6KRK8_9ROSI|nr:hypothetical protein FH972_022208 [Carpinus fangiana]